MKDTHKIREGLTLVYEDLCPVCGGWLTDREVEEGYCKNTGTPFDESVGEEYNKIKSFEEFFGQPLKPLQRMWTLRVLRGESFAITSPTGTGKSTFGVRMAEYLALSGRRCYLIVPTTNLVKQTRDRMISHLKSKRGVDERDIIVYHGNLPEKEKEEVLLKIRDGSFRILITTASFLVFHYTELKNNRFDFIFVDDLDAVLKGSKNLPKILRLLGYDVNQTPKGSGTTKPKKRVKKGQLVIATATAKPGESTRILREVLGIDVSSTKHLLRNIRDYKIPIGWTEREGIPEDVLTRLTEIIHEWRSGILVFLPREDWVDTVVSRLKDEGVRVGTDEEISRFATGDLDVLVGVSAPYGRLVRGIDLPERTRVAIFCGIPHRRIRIDNIPPDSWIIGLLVNNLPEVKKRLGFSVLPKGGLSEEEMMIFRDEIKRYDGRVMGTVLIAGDEIVIPDMKTYIQASGRTSRMTSQGMTPGVSIIIDDPKRLEVFEIKASMYDVEINPYDYGDAVHWLERSEEGRVEPRPVLVVVESPTKAKEIARFFGRPALRVINKQPFYEIYSGEYVLIITASLGHTVDLITKRYFHGVEVYPEQRSVLPHYTTIKRCKDLGVQFTDEDIDCKDLHDSRSIIENLRYVSREVDRVFIATDPDVEGEKIGWDLSQLLPDKEISRIELHEITKPAFLRAIGSPRTLNNRLVHAQVVRRVEDRWIGFELSDKVRKAFESNNLSAGRVQTPVLGWIIDYYKKSKRKVKRVVLDVDGVRVDLPEIKPDVKPGRVRVDVKKAKEYEEERNPLPPYTTDELLRDAHKRFGLSSRETMDILQRLFENGLITYHRTDSTHVSEQGLRIARIFLGEDFQGRHWGSSGAHECIRPTRPLTVDDIRSFLSERGSSIQLDSSMLKVYDLVFRRFMASQGKPMRVKHTIYRIRVKVGQYIEKDVDIVVDVQGRTYELYPYVFQTYTIKPGTRRGRVLIEKVPEAYPLTEGDVIRLMRERSIGRPSTYAQIINKLYKRHYIVEKKGRLYPTQLGEYVYNYLTKHFKEFVSEEKTREMYQLMDDVEEGKREVVDVLLSMYEEIVREVREKPG